jgi:hypothetical protein
MNYVEVRHFIDSDRLGPLYVFFYFEFGIVMTDRKVEGIEIYLFPGGQNQLEFAQWFANGLEVDFEGKFYTEL